MRIRNSLFLMFLCLILLLTACSGGGEQPTSTASTGNTNMNKDTLVIGLDDDPPQLDPHRSTAAVDRQVFQSLYNTLIDIDEDLNFVPELAKDWEISEDGKTYTFYLQENVNFHDGTPFNAQAVKFNFERMLNPEFGSPRKSEINLVESVEVVDEYTVKIHLKEPYSPFLSVLTDRAGMMISPTAVKKLGRDFANQPVGTGPYKFVERVQQSHIKLKLFEDYWREKPDIPNIVYKPYPDGNTRVTNLISGDLDIINKVPFKDIEKLKNNPKIKVSEKGALGFQGIMLNTEKPPFNNKKVRQAVNLAINRDAIVKVVFKNGAIPAASPFPPTSWAYPEELEVPKQNIEKAKQLLAQSGLTNIKFTLKITPKPEEKQLGQMLQSMLGQIGIQVEIEMVEFGTLLQQMRAHDFQAIRLGWSGRIDPDGNAYSWFTSNGSLNEMGYSNPKVDKLLSEARTINDREKRKELYAEVARILQEDVPYVFLYHPKDYKAMKSYVKGYHHIADGMIRTETIFFAN